MKWHPILFSTPMVQAILAGNKTQTRRVVKGEVGKHPYALGDLLWVRETWAHDCPHCDNPKCGNESHIWYKASEEPLVADSFAGPAQWRPSIFMPSWASRISLRVTGLRYEPLQAISETDAQAEGADKEFEVDAAEFIAGKRINFDTASTYRIGYKHLWDELNKDRGYGWAINPTVRVIQFERTEAVYGQVVR